MSGQGQRPQGPPRPRLPPPPLGRGRAARGRAGPPPPPSGPPRPRAPPPPPSVASSISTIPPPAHPSGAAATYDPAPSVSSLSSSFATTSVSRDLSSDSPTVSLESSGPVASTVGAASTTSSKRLEEVKTSPEVSPEMTQATVPPPKPVVPFTDPPGSSRERVEPPPRPNQPTVYSGQDGRKHTIASNYLKLELAEGKGVFEYEVSYEPRVDNRNSRFRLMNQHRDVYGAEKSFDGVKLFLPHKLPDKVTTLYSTLEETGEQVKVNIAFKREKHTGDRDVVQFFNILFNRIFRMLKFSQHNRNFYDPAQAHSIKQYNLQVWPGYVTAVDFYSGGLYVQIDVSHRVLRTETVRDVLMNLMKGCKDFKTEAEKQLLGASVITRYNNKSYKIDDLDFESSPQSTFADAQGNKISYVEYYRKQYSIDIKDLGQPLLIHRPRKTSVSEQEVQKLICLVPELCMMTGMTDSMRADFRIMKEVSNFTRLTPEQRKVEMLGFVRRVAECDPATKLLQGWGLTIVPTPPNIEARILPAENIFFGNNYRETVSAKADWGRTATTRPCLTPVNLMKWGVVFPEKNKLAVQGFCKTMSQVASRMAIQISNPKPIPVANDRTETYLNSMRDLIDPSVQLMMVVVPAQKSDRYAAIKKLCCIEKPVASQVIVLKTISNEKRLSAVAQKVALQINCKLGGELWACQTPYKGIMVVGIDVFHEKGRRSGSVAGIVSTMNDNMSRYYSNVAIQKEGQELVDALKVAFMDSMIRYYEENHTWPANIVVFRDGVSDSQMDTTAKHEMAQLTRTFEAISRGMPQGSSRDVADRYQKLREKNLPGDYQPGFNFAVVQKRINTRMFTSKQGPKGVMYENPPPGTVLDHTVTRYEFKDFFLVPQSVNQGTVSPTHFVVLGESGRNPLDANHMQRLAYKLTHMYYNWPGTVRVPAVCQYAHKLVDLVGENLHQVPSPNLANKLYYL